MRTPIDWDELFLRMAFLVAERSKDDSTQVGCILVSPGKRRIHIGFNGFAIGINDTFDRWERPTKYDYVIHAEQNAIINARENLSGWTAYLTIFPCQKCASLLVQAGIKRVVYSGEYSGLTGDLDFAKRIFIEAGVVYEQRKVE